MDATPRAFGRWAPSERYPDPAVEVLDPSFAKYRLFSAAVERLATGMRWSEGPVWFGDGRYLLWSDIPNNRIMQYAEGLGVRVWRHPSNNSNGHTRDREGRLVSCEHGTRRVTRTEYDGSLTVLADKYKGKRLNSPNDVVVKSDGSIWFTDPPYGILSDYEGHKAESEIGHNHVYRLDPGTGALSVVADDFNKPNGIAFSLDEKTLYVADTGGSHDAKGEHHIRSFTVEGGKRLTKGKVFAEISPGLADGFRLDVEGNVWTSAGDGVHCYTREGKLLGKVKVPEVVANVCFGGPKRNRLFITATRSLYAVYLSVAGALRP
jgi:gluconolactonase